MSKKSLFLFLIIFSLISCAPKPGPNLASKASFIHPGVTTKEEVLRFLGPPVQVFVFPDKKEEWYYYYRIRNTWAKIPVAKEIKGEDYTQVLKLVIKDDKVVDVKYYTVGPGS